jgi:hypothetical protein
VGKNGSIRFRCSWLSHAEGLLSSDPGSLSSADLYLNDSPLQLSVTDHVFSGGFVLIKLNNPSAGPEANQYSFALVYDTWSTDEHEANGPGGSFFWIFALGESLFGGPKLGSKTIDLIKTNPSETTWSVTDNCKALSFK